MAYEFDTSAEADKAGCDLVRVHIGKADPKTGQMQDFEDVVWCCPE